MVVRIPIRGGMILIVMNRGNCRMLRVGFILIISMWSVGLIWE